MRRCSMAILNHAATATATATATAGDGEFPNPSRRTPDHPPYSEMVRVALQSLAEENGSTESSISSFIQSTFNDLPWGHARLLPYYLRKLVADGELTSPSPLRFQLPFSSPIRRGRGRPRLYPNPNPNPRRRTSAFPRRRGRPPKVHAEDVPPRGRGRSRLRRRSGFRVSGSRGSKRRKDGSFEKSNCLSEDSAFFVDVKNGVCEQFLGGEEPLLLLDEGRPRLGEEPPGLAPEETEFRQDQSMLGGKLPLLTPEQGKPVHFSGSEVFERDHGQSMPPEQMRGRSRLRRGASIGRRHTRGSGLRLPGSRGSKKRKDRTPVSNIEKLNCQSENSAFFIDVKNGGPEQSDVSKGQFLGEEAPLLHLDPGSMPPCLASEQGKPLPFLASNQSTQEAASPFMPPMQSEPVQRLRRGASIGRTQTRRSGPRLPSSRGSKRRKGSAPVSDIEKLNCQSENSAFFNDVKNGGSECVVLEQGQPFVSPEQSDVNKGQFLGTIPPFLGPQHYEFVEGQQLLEEESMLGEQLPLLTPEQGKSLPFLASKVFEHDHGQTMQEAAPPFMPPNQTEPIELPREKLPFFTPNSGKVEPFLAPELSKHDHGHEGAKGEEPSWQRETPPITALPPGKVSPFLSPEFLEHDQGQSSKGEEPSFMSTEQTERDHGLPLAPSEESEEGHDQRLVGIGAADHKGEELVLMPRRDEEEVENAPVTSRKSKLYGKRRSLRLWFES